MVSSCYQHRMSQNTHSSLFTVKVNHDFNSTGLFVQNGDFMFDDDGDDDDNNDDNDNNVNIIGDQKKKEKSVI